MTQQEAVSPESAVTPTGAVTPEEDEAREETTVSEAGTGTDPATPRDRRTRINVGLGRLLIFVYGLFALSAGGRAVVQIATKFHVAPLAYILSAIAAVIYLVATISLARSTPTSRRVAIVCCSVELIGVVAVGLLSLANRSAFPGGVFSEDATVWSTFGLGYGLVPAILPIVGLWWVWKGPSAGGAPSQNPV